MAYAPCDGGVFTDTDNYTGLVGECTNVSVGYYSEHTVNEVLDTDHALALRDALIALDPDQLVYERQPGEIDPDAWSWSSHMDWENDYRDGRAYGSDNDNTSDKRRAMRELVEDNPDAIADLLEQYGFDYASLADEIWQLGDRPGCIKRFSVS
jgi:hypothetical protein